MNEVWRDIPSYEGYYQASNLGGIRNTKTGKLLTLVKDSQGYLRVVLYKNGKKNYRVHQLIAMTFIPNPNELPMVHHKNEDKSCNIVDLDNLYGETTNLEWCTHQYNISFSKAKKINQYDLEGNFIKMWDSTMDIERELNIHHAHISKCCKGKYKTSGGYHWQYKD